MNRETFWKYYKHSSFGVNASATPKEFAKIIGFEGLIADGEEKRRTPDKCRVDIEKVERALHVVWSQIYSDMENSAKIGGWKLTNTVAVETCLDMDNIMNFADVRMMYHAQDGTRKQYGKSDAQAADEEIKRAVSRFGYERVLAYLAKHIQLV